METTADRDILEEIREIFDDNGTEADRTNLLRTDKRTEQRRQWDAENLRTVSTRLPIDIAREFERECQEAGVSQYAVLKSLILDLMLRHKYYGSMK